MNSSVLNFTLHGEELGCSWWKFLQQNEAGRVIKLTPPPAPPPQHTVRKTAKTYRKRMWEVECVLAEGEGGGGSTEVFNKKQSQEKTTFCHEKSAIFGITCYLLFISCFLRVRSSRPATISHYPPPPCPRRKLGHFTPELYNTNSRMVFSFLVFSFAIIAW